MKALTEMSVYEFKEHMEQVAERLRALRNENDWKMSDSENADIASCCEKMEDTARLISEHRHHLNFPS